MERARKGSGRNLVVEFGKIAPPKFFHFHPPTHPNTKPSALGCLEAPFFCLKPLAETPTEPYTFQSSNQWTASVAHVWQLQMPCVRKSMTISINRLMHEGSQVIVSIHMYPPFTCLDVNIKNMEVWSVLSICLK